MLKEGGDAGKMGMAAHRGRVRDKLEMWLPKYLKPRGSLGAGQREKCTEEWRARAHARTRLHSGELPRNGVVADFGCI